MHMILVLCLRIKLTYNTLLTITAIRIKVIQGLTDIFTIEWNNNRNAIATESS